VVTVNNIQYQCQCTVSVNGTLAPFGCRKRKHKDAKKPPEQSEAGKINELQNNQLQRMNENGVNHVNGNTKSKKKKKDFKDCRKKEKNK